MEAPSIPLPLRPEDVRTLDAQYKPFEPFAQWSATEVDLRDWDRARAKLDLVRASAPADAVRSATRGAMQGAAADTGAIEGLYPHDRGFTLTVATDAAKWEVELARKDEEVRLLLQDQLRAYDLALDAATKAMPISEALIRRLHEELCASQRTYEVHVFVNDEIVVQKQPLPRGQYKEHPNHVRQADGSVHAYSPAAMTGPEMARLVAEVESEAFGLAHPARQAAYAHHALTAIHPFADGNGRVARTLASVFFFRAISIPLVVFYEQRNVYYDALAAADAGKLAPFVRFITERGVDAMELIADRVRDGPEVHLSRLAELLTIKGGITYDELVDLGNSLRSVIKEELTKQVSTLSLPRGVTGQVETYGGGFNDEPPSGYREIRKGDQSFYGASFRTSAPSAHASVHMRVVTAESADDSYPLAIDALIRGRESKREVLYLRLADSFPALSSVAAARLSSWIRSVLGEAAAMLASEVAKELRKQG